MKIIFVRHGEPDYSNDSLTERGKIEAEILSKRISKWDVDEFYVSPLGRAVETAKPTLEKMNRKAITLPYMREFSYHIDDPISKRHGVPWDFVSSDWTKNDYMFETEDGFLKYPCISANPEIAKNYYDVIANFDKLLETYDYKREGRYYRHIGGEERFLKGTVGPNHAIIDNGPKGKEKTIVIFCHLGVTCLVLSHLINIPFETLTHGFFMPTTSLTIVATEERWSNEAYFRVQTLGDTSHLYESNTPISPAGFFASPFQG